MTWDEYVVIVRVGSVPEVGGCSVVVSHGGAAVVVAQGLDLGSAVKVASRVCGRLDNGDDLAAVGRFLEDGEGAG